ncbi:MAG: ATP-binding protein [Chloroflexi bacterium]|nr:ATP-binding protein [Chloroflexota bacterium]
MGLKRETTPTSANAESGAKVEPCPICGGMGYVTRDVPINHPDFGKAFACVCQRDQIAERRRNHLQRISNMSAYRQFRFDTFQTTIHGLAADQNAMLGYIYDLVSFYAQQPDGWLLLQGGYGSGKTHLAAAVGNYQLDQGHEVVFVTVPDLLDHLRVSYSAGAEVSYDDLFMRVRSTPFLILDDLGTESPTAWAGEKLFQLLNHRYVHRLPTVVTTNRAIERMDERIRSRLLDENLTRIVHMNLPDFRRGAIEQGQSELSNLALYGDMTFENFDLRRSSNLQRALERARNFAANPQGWLIFHGVHGCGKTHLAAAIANHHKASGQPMLFVTVADLLDYLRSGMKEEDGLALNRRFKEVRQVPLLILDDFHTKTASAWATEKLFQIIDYRYLARLPMVITIFSENLVSLGDRFESRFKDRRICTIFEITAGDYHGGTSSRPSS